MINIRQIGSAAYHMVSVLSMAVIIALGIVWAFTRDGPKVTASEPRNVSAIVKAEGSLTFTWDYTVKESCPRTFVYAFAPPEGAPIITVLRPVIKAMLPPGDYPNRQEVIELPAGVRPGPWTLRMSAVSRCPLGTQSDDMLSIQFGVVE